MLENILLSHTPANVVMLYTKSDDYFDAVNDIGEKLGRYYGELFHAQPLEKIDKVTLEERMPREPRRISIAMKGQYIKSVDAYVGGKQIELEVPIHLGYFNIRQLKSKRYLSFLVAFHRRNNDFTRTDFTQDLPVSVHDARGFYYYVKQKLF